MSSASGSDRTLRRLAWLVFFASLLLAVWAYWIDPVINRDGTKYVLAAETFTRGDFYHGFRSYKWPIYSMVIAFFSWATPFSAETIAYVINACLRGVTGIAFLHLSSMMGADRRQLLLAAVIFLLFPGLNEVQAMIIRDFGYFASFLWMAIFFLRQLGNPTRVNVIGFIVLGLIATAFRIEGLIYVSALVIFYMLSGTVKGHWKLLGYFIILTVIPILGYIELMWLYNGEIGNAVTMLTDTAARMTTELDEYIEELEPGIVANLLNSIFYLILAMTPFAKMAWSTLSVLSLGYVLVLAAGWFVRPVFDQQNANVRLMTKGWRWIVGMNVMVLVTFALLRQIVTDRYPITLALVLMLLIPFIITKLMDKARQSAWNKAPTAVVAILSVLLLLNSAEGLNRFANNRHMKEAGEWIDGRMLDGDVFYTNSRIVDYYAGRRSVRDDRVYSWEKLSEFLHTGRWRQIHRIGVYLRGGYDPRTDEYLQSVFQMEPEKVFESENGSKVLIYNTRPH